MCSRITAVYSWQGLRELLSFDWIDLDDPPPPRWNIAPTDLVSVIRTARDGKAEIVNLRWGFTMARSTRYAPGPDQPERITPINARSETAATSPMFRGAMKSRRCIVPVSGFYEWKAVEPAPGQPAKSTKHPHYIHPKDNGIMLLAGLWEPPHTDAPDEPGTPGTFAILTTRPNALMTGLHDRMPVILHPRDAAAWLAPSPLPDAPRYFEPHPADHMTARRVSTRVNSVRNDGAGLIEPWTEPVEPPGLFG